MSNPQNTTVSTHKSGGDNTEVESNSEDVPYPDGFSIFTTFIESQNRLPTNHSVQPTSKSLLFYAVAKLSSTAHEKKIITGKSNSCMSAYKDLFKENMNLPNWKDCTSIKIYANFAPTLDCIQHFLAALKERRVNLSKPLEIVFVTHHKFLEKKRSRNGFSNLKKIVNIETFILEDWMELGNILGLKDPLPEYSLRVDPHEMMKIFINSGLPRKPFIPVNDVFAIAQITSGEIRQTIIAKNIQLMHHAERNLIHQLRQLFRKYEGNAFVKIWINFSPCHDCSNDIANFCEEMQENNIFIKMEIVFSCLYTIKTDSCAGLCHQSAQKDTKHNQSLEGLKMLRHVVSLKSFDQTEWQELGNVLMLGDGWRKNILAMDIRNEQDKAIRNFLQLIETT